MFVTKSIYILTKGEDMSIISINNFSQNFGDKLLFENTSFMLNPGEKMGLTGVNGAGKSTLIKIIMGQVLVDKGEVYRNNKYNIVCLDQHAEINQDCTVKEYLAGAYSHLFALEEKLNKINERLATETDADKLETLMYQSGDLYEKLEENNFYAIDSEIQKIASGLGVTALGLDRKVNTLSGGQRAKAMLAKLLLESPDVMILDEPTNFLDVEHIDWLTKFITGSDKTFLIVSHDADFLNKVVNVVCDVDNNKINRYVGNLEQMEQVKLAKREQLEKGYKLQQKEIKKLEDYIARNKARASTANMAKSREKKLEKMDIIIPPSEQIKPTFSFNYKPFESSIVLKTTNLEVGYSNALLPPISLEVRNGDRIAITGFNGIGKSTFLKTILGIINPISGSVAISKNVVTGYYEQENDFRNFEGTPLSYVSQFYPKINEKDIRSVLNKCGLNSVHLRKQVGRLSGGEQSKIKIGMLVLKPCNLLVLDEPTNHLDVFAVDRLKQAIAEFGGTVIFVSHNKQFVKDVATRVIDMEKLAK